MSVTMFTMIMNLQLFRYVVIAALMELIIRGHYATEPRHLVNAAAIFIMQVCAGMWQVQYHVKLVAIAAGRPARGGR